MINSTIDPTQPAALSGFSSQVLRNQFLAAFNDINSLWGAVNAIFTYLAGLSPVGSEVISNLTAAVHLSPPFGATVAIIAATGAGVVYLDDGNVPTPTRGIAIPQNGAIFYTGPLSNVQFIEQNPGAGISVIYYQPVTI